MSLDRIIFIWHSNTPSLQSYTEEVKMRIGEFNKHSNTPNFLAVDKNKHIRKRITAELFNIFNSKMIMMLLNVFG